VSPSTSPRAASLGVRAGKIMLGIPADQGDQGLPSRDARTVEKEGGTRKTKERRRGTRGEDNLQSSKRTWMSPTTSPRSKSLGERTGKNMLRLAEQGDQRDSALQRPLSPPIDVRKMIPGERGRGQDRDKGKEKEGDEKELFKWWVVPATSPAGARTGKVMLGSVCKASFFLSAPRPSPTTQVL